MNKFCVIFLVIILVSPDDLFGQESIFELFQQSEKKADNYYEKGMYAKAVEVYEKMHKKNDADAETLRKLANSYYNLNQLDVAGKWYEKYQEAVEHKMDDEIILNYASCMQAVGKIDRALILLLDYQDDHPDDFEISKRIWQLQNINFLYEDSVFYSVEPVPFQTEFDEIAPVIHGDELIYLSNQDDVEIIKRTEGASGKGFFSWCETTIKTSENDDDSKKTQYSRWKYFAKEIDAKYHKGAISFTTTGDTMAFTRSNDVLNKNGVLTTDLFFARIENGKWIEYGAFQFNSPDYSIYHPALSEDSKTLYFASDMPGGFGGKDLYKSELVNGNWSSPQNLGNEINTSQDESHPFFYKDILYFSSNGHPGLGGLDIFKVRLSDKVMEIMNIGYPINSVSDDFDIVLDSTAAHGYLVSNRGTSNDNIFEVTLSRITFPIVVHGVIKFKSNNYVADADATELEFLPDAKLELIDKSSNKTINTSETDKAGNFSIEIPYESQFLLKVNQEELGEALVSMEIPRNHLDYLNHEIVILKDDN